MAIVQATGDSYSNVLRQVYTPKLWELQNRDRILFQMIARDTANYSEGTQINVRLHVHGNGGVGWATGGYPSGGGNPSLPTAGVQKFGSATTNYKRLYGRMKIDGPVLAGSREGYAAEVRALEFEARNLVEDLADALSFDIWQDTVTDSNLAGALGGALSVPSGGADINEFRIPIAGNGIKNNMIIDVMTTAGVTTEGGTKRLVTSVAVDSSDSTLFLVTIDSDTDLGGTGDVAAATYYAYRQGSRGNAIDGLKGIVLHTGTYLGINRATAGNEFWKAQRLANGGTNREITLPLMQEMLDEIEKNSPGRCNLIICGHAIWRKIANILVPDKRYGGDIKTLYGWCEAVMFRGIPVVRDKYAPANNVFFLDTTTFTLYQDSEGGFIDEDGQILHWVVGEDAFEAAWRRFLQLVCHDPASNGVLQDINEA